MTAEIGRSGGSFKRAGQGAWLVGLDWPAALAQAPEGIDRERLVPLLRAWEAGALSGVAKRTPEDGK